MTNTQTTALESLIAKLAANYRAAASRQRAASEASHNAATGDTPVEEYRRLRGLSDFANGEVEAAHAAHMAALDTWHEVRSNQAAA
jgi:hypothetical protein